MSASSMHRGGGSRKWWGRKHMVVRRKKGGLHIMVKTRRSLLALIYQHLLKSGYCKAARELQIESGEKFTTSKLTLREVYKNWKKKAKKKGSKKNAKKDVPKTKKPRVQDRESSSDSSDEEEIATKKTTMSTPTPQAKAIKGKGVGAKQKMNLATESAADVKEPLRITVDPVNLPDSSSDSSDGEETAPVKAAPVQGANLKPTPGKEKGESSSSSESEAETAKQRNATATPGKTVLAAGQNSLSKATSNGNAQDSDETDIEKLPASVTTKLTASTAKDKTLKPQVEADSSSESSETEDEDKPANKKTPAVLPVSQQKTPLDLTKAAKALKSKPVVAAKAKSPVKAPPPAAESSEEETSDSEEELAAKRTPATPLYQGKTPKSTTKTATALPSTPVVAAKAKSPLKISHAVDSSSDEESSDSDEVAKKTPTVPVHQLKSPTNLTQTAKVSNLKPVVAAKAKSPVKAPPPADDSSEEETSDSEEEPATKKTAATPSSQVKTPNSTTKTPTALPSTPVVAAKTPLKISHPETESSEEESSDSEEELVAKKTPPAVSSSLLKTPSPGVTRTALPSKSVQAAKAKTPQPPVQISESSDSSDDDDEPANKKTPVALSVSQLKTPPGFTQTAKLSKPKSVVAAKAKTPVKAPPPAAESSEEETSDSEEETVIKPIAITQGSKRAPNASTPVLPAKPKIQINAEESSDANSKVAAKVYKKATNLKRTKPVPLVVKTPLKTLPPADESSEDESDSGDELTAELKTPSRITAQTPVVAAKAKQSPLKTSQPADESSEEESESDKESVAKQTAKTTGSQPNTPSATTKQTAVIVAKAKIPLKTQLSVDSSEEESSDSEEEPATKVLSPKAAVPAVQLKVQAKASTPAKAVLQTKPRVATHEMSSSSDSSDSEEEKTQPQKPAVPTVTKQKKRPSSGPLSPSTPCDVPAKSKTAVPVRSTPAAKAVAVDTESSDTSSDEETEQVKTPASSAVKSKDAKVVDKPAKTPTLLSPAKGKAENGIKVLPAAKKLPAKVSSESSDRESSEKSATKVNAAASGAIKASQEKLKPLIPSKPMDGKVKAAGQAKTVLLKQADPESSSESSESEEEPAAKPMLPTPNRATPKSVGKTAAKLAALSSVGKKQESTSESSSDDEEELVKPAVPAVGKKQNNPKPTTKPTMLMSPRSKEVVSVVEAAVDQISIGLLAGKEDQAQPKSDVAGAGIVTSSQKLAKKGGKVSGVANSNRTITSSPTKAKDRSNGTQNSQPEDSQSQVKVASPTFTVPKKRKVDSEDSLVLVSEKARKKKTKGQPETAPDPPTIASPNLVPPASVSALLESEEETVLALLEGRSPKKAKTKKASKNAAVADTATNPAQNDRSVKSPPPHGLTKIISASDDRNNNAQSTEVITMSEKKKSSKKRKAAQDDLDKQKEKSAKKAKKDQKEKKKQKLAALEKSPKKDKKKSDKDKTKKRLEKESKKKKKKEEKKMAQSIPVVESTDSGIGLSKPKKKKKMKVDKD